MRQVTFPFKLLLVLLLCSLLAPSAASAQATEFTIHINDMRGPNPIQHPSGLPGLALELDFTLLNLQGEVVQKAEFQSSSLVLDNGDVYTTQANKTEEPWSIAILIDTSKTMYNSGAVKPARTAVADSLGQIPGGSNIALLTFNDQVTSNVDFTKDTKTLDTTLRRIEAKAGAKPCVYAAVYSALKKLSGASGRRALFLMTASKDECQNQDPQEVIDFARSNHIEIYAVGINGYSVGEEDLTQLTDPTGGLTNLREQGELLFGVENVMKALSAQFTVKAIVFPLAGSNTAQVSVILSNGSVVDSKEVPFESDQDYIRPPEIAIKGQVRPVGKSLTFGLTIASPDLINKLVMSVISKKTGDSVVTQETTEFTDTYKVAADALKVGEEYTLVVAAMDDKGRILSQTVAEFRFEPPETSLEIQVEPSEDKSAFTVTVDSSNLEGVVKYKVFLVSAQGNASVPGTTQTIAVGDPISIPVKDPESGNYLETGAYRVMVQALDSDNKVLVQIPSEDFEYQRPSTLEIAIKWVSERPLAIVGISLACFVAFVGLIAVVWMLIPKPSSRPKTVELVVPEKMRRPAPVDDASMYERPRQPPEPERPVRRAPPEPKPVARPAPPPAVKPATPAASSDSVIRSAQYSPPPAPDVKAALPKACIKSSEPATLRISMEITKSPFTIGRRDGNDLVVKVDNTLGVSGHHATITFNNNRYFVADNKSTYGVIVNGQKIQPATSVPLEDGMIIGLGPKVKFHFHLGNCP